MPTCNVCQSDDFTAKAGFYYCDDCGTQSLMHQELEYDTYFGGLESRLTKSAIKVATDTKSLELTSWEEYNYILVGLVTELITLGAKPELKLVTLQLWSAYLRANEAAFFSRKEVKIPKLSASFKKKDAEILYNLKRQKRKRTRSATAASSGLSNTSSVVTDANTLRRQYRKKQRNLMRSEYEALQSEPDTNNASLAATLNRSSGGASSSGPSSHTSNASSGAVRVEFSRLSRRLLKRIMPKKHLRKHEQDGTISCHAFQRQNYRRNYHPEIVSRNMMYELLYLALNQIDDSIQLGDMLRFIKEGHLTFTNVVKFLPDDLSAEQRIRLQNSFTGSASTCPSNAFIRLGAKQLSQLIGVHMRMPDLAALTARYVAELALPDTVHKIIETLLTICPPLMATTRTAVETAPYEARAVAFVLFAMKLLFGLDDERECRISVSAQRINKRLRKMSGDLRQKPLFVWTEWQQYVEMRNVILAQCHYATADVQDSVATAETAHLYTEFLRSNRADAEAFDLPDTMMNSHRNQDRASMMNMSIIFGKAAQLHAREKGEALGEPTTTLNFPPTLQPKSSYLERLLEDDVMSATIHIPSFMYTDHSARDMVPFLRPGELRRRLPAGHCLRVHRLSGVQRFKIEPPFLAQWPDLRLPHSTHWTLRSYEMNIDSDSWKKQVRRNDEEILKNDVIKSDELLEAVIANLEHIKTGLKTVRTKARQSTTTTDPTSTTTINMKTGLNTEREKATSTTTTNSNATLIDLNESAELFTQPLPSANAIDDDNEHDAIPAAQMTTETLQPRRIDETVPLFEMILSEDEADVDENDDDDDNTAPLQFYLNSFDYWLRSGRVDEIKYSVFAELCTPTMPQNFVWLLRQCAQLIECQERDVYRELMIIENFFAYRLAPVEQMRNVACYLPERRSMHIPDVLMRSRQTNPLY